MADRDTARNLGLRSEPSVERSREWVLRAASDAAFAPFAIVLDGRHVGNVVLDLIDTYLGTARLSIYVGERDVRGRGVAQSALSLVADEARTLGLHKLWLIVHDANVPAIRAYERAGWEREGVLRDEFLLDGERSDALRMGLLLNGT